MYKKFFLPILSAIVLAIACVPDVMAFSTSLYATSSKLKTGKWVKIAVKEDGVYELTYSELRAMGFSDPSKVRILGYGGHMQEEKLVATAIDDLKYIYVARYGEKLVFYANGPVQHTLYNPTSSTPYYKRTVNTYSTHGYYFLTESSEGEYTVQTKSTVSQGSTKRDASFNYVRHEEELASYSQSGKDLLGEDMKEATVTVPMQMDQLVEGSTIYVNACVAGKPTAAAYIECSLNGTEVPFTLSRAKIYAPATSYTYYNTASPVAGVVLDKHSENVDVKVSLDCPTGSITSSRLDYITLTYRRHNTFTGAANGQFRIGIESQKVDDRIEIQGNPSSVVVWNVDDTEVPINYTTSTYSYVDTDDGTTHTVKAFTPGVATSWAQYVAFDPTQTLMKIDGYTEVPNQDLHGMVVPEMVIITNKALIEQAQRIATMHRTYDGIRVEVVDQEKVFNEFSSGTPDAMAYRRLCKMLYDRNASRFKYLLLFGGGSYDNRGMLANRDKNILTYQSNTSNDEDYSYTTDDFFGFLDDNSGGYISSDIIRIGIGRIPCIDEAEAKSDVDKLVEYVTNPDYGDWRNNIMLAADEGDNGLHMFQAEGMREISNDELNTGMQINRVYVAQYPKANETWITDESRRTSAEAKRRMTDLFTQGQYFYSYIGHAGPTTFTKVTHLWTSSDAQSTSYKHLPMVTTAACDVARYDSDSRGIAEIMFHKPDGGAIAMLTSTRSVYAESNDALNTAFFRNFMCYSTQGMMPTLGYTYMKAKQSFGTASNTNKLSFLLLGDPAMKVNYPKPFVRIEKLNNKSLEGDTLVINPLTQVTVEARITDNNLVETDDTFDGDVTVTLYDAERYFDTYTGRVMGVSSTITRDCYYSRDVLAKQTGRVVNGKLSVTLNVPRTAIANDDQVLIRVYAHRDNSDDMVNGYTDRIKLGAYDESLVTVNDTEAPAINAMYIDNEHTFADGATVPSSSTLYINVSDNIGVSVQDIAIGQNMTLVLDGSKVYSTVKNYASQGDDNTLNIAFPLTDIEAGTHKLTYTVFDLSGNKATRTINFVVSAQWSTPTLAIEETTAVDKATFNFSHNLGSDPAVTVKVENAAGKVVWSKVTTSFPIEWDLKDNSGKRVPAGVYTYYGNVDGGAVAGGTDRSTIVVVNPL